MRRCYSAHLLFVYTNEKTVKRQQNQTHGAERDLVRALCGSLYVSMCVCVRSARVCLRTSVRV